MLLAHYNSIQPLIHTCGRHIILQTECCTASLSTSLPSFQHQREGQGGGRERRTGSLSSLQLLLRTLVWSSLLVRTHFHSRQQAAGQGVEHWLDGFRRSLFGITRPVTGHRKAFWPAPTAASMQQGEQSVYKPASEKQAVYFPRSSSNDKHGKVTKASSSSSTYCSLSFCFLIAGLHPGPGEQPQGPR